MRKQRSRIQILNAAIIEFEKAGVDKVSMGGLAKAAGLTRATIYNLFDSKEAIAQAIVEQQVQEWSELFQKRIVAAENGIQILTDLLIANSKICQKYPNIAYTVLTKPNARVLPEGDETKSFRHLVISVIKLCQKQDSLRSDLPSTYLLFMILGVYTQMMIFSITSKASVSAQQIEQMLQTLIVGIGVEVKS